MARASISRSERLSKLRILEFDARDGPQDMQVGWGPSAALEAILYICGTLMSMARDESVIGTLSPDSKPLQFIVGEVYR